MGFLRRKKKEEEQPVDLNARSPQLGVKYKDLAVMGQLMQQGADLRLPRHALYYLYFSARPHAEVAAVEAQAAGYACEVREPMPEHPDQWSLVCERDDAILDPPGVVAADDLFQGIADRHGAEYDGWEAAAKP